MTRAANLAEDDAISAGAMVETCGAAGSTMMVTGFTPSPARLVAVMFTSKDPTCRGLPIISPEKVSMLRPGGRLVAP